MISVIGKLTLKYSTGIKNMWTVPGYYPPVYPLTKDTKTMARTVGNIRLLQVTPRSPTLRKQVLFLAVSRVEMSGRTTVVVRVIDISPP